MAEIKKETGLLLMVDKDIINLGEAKKDDVFDYEFEFKGTPEQIEYIEKSCGCTSAYFEDGKIKGKLDISKTQTSDFPEGETVITKYIFVWLNDGQSRFIANERKERIGNPIKSYFKLTLTAKVVV